MQAMYLKAAQSEPMDGEVVDARAVKSARRMLIVGLGSRPRGICRTHPNAITLPAGILQHDGIAVSRITHQLDPIQSNGKGIEITGRSFSVDARKHLDLVAGRGICQRRADGVARVYNQRACRSRSDCDY